ncbi:MAG TPA: hypothetical protein VJN71_01055 [Nitrososphaerales archaeon]|nr:hypothetical protein [Nitrososphaerales archaeon]
MQQFTKLLLVMGSLVLMINVVPATTFAWQYGVLMNPPETYYNGLDMPT